MKAAPLAVSILALVACSPGGGGGDPGDGDGCGDCGDGRICSDGQCIDLPAECPCPAESYCDLATASCVAGCLGDGDCSGARICEARQCRAGCREDPDCAGGEICDDTVCRRGCRATGDCADGEICDAMVCRTGCERDADCPRAGDICDDASQLCRAGCRGDGDCAGEQLCDPDGDRCQAGCRDDGGCATGRICQDGACRDGCRDDEGCPDGALCDGSTCRAGCRDHAECPLEQICATPELVCADGCGPEGSGSPEDGITDRCPVGTACTPHSWAGAGYQFDCSPRCNGWDCKSTATEVYQCWGSTAFATYCLKECDADADCGDGENCQYHDEYGFERFCRAACTTDDDCGMMWLETTGSAPCDCDVARGKCFFTSPGWAPVECSHQEAPV